ncbi:MAG TPA: LysR substrate-binding domain-containing protein, partial [Rhodoferax sp.]|nr:LysR substrate-binding domain-containing protein [Rhodoferax sp.]
ASSMYASTNCPSGLTPHNFRQIPFIAFNRKDDLQTEFVGRACGLRRVSLSQRFVPSSEGQVRAVLAGWGASVLPELQVRGLLGSGELVNLAPKTTLPVNLYWHCWNLDSVVIDRLTEALATAAGAALKTTRS